MPNITYKSCYYLFILLPQKVWIFTCRYFKLSWNTTALSQSNCSNFSCSSIISWIVKKNCPCQLHEKSIAPTFIFVLSKARSSNPMFYDVTKSIFRLTFWWTLFLSTIRNHKSIKKYAKYSTKWRSFSVVSNLTTKYRIQLLHFFVSL